MGARRDIVSQKPRYCAAVVLAALTAILIQLFVPAAVMAADIAAGRQTMVICTGMGVETVDAPGGGERGKGFAGLPCQDCVAPAGAVLPPSEATPVAVVYVAERIERRTVERLIDLPRPAPPRPPGQGPPAFDV